MSLCQQSRLLNWILHPSVHFQNLGLLWILWNRYRENDIVNVYNNTRMVKVESPASLTLFPMTAWKHPSSFVSNSMEVVCYCFLSGFLLKILIQPLVALPSQY